jgi:hypothetical protein
MPTFSWQPLDGSSQMVVTAEEAELKYNPDTNALGIKLTNMEMVGDKVHGVWPDTMTYEIPLSIASRKGDLSRTPSEIALGDLAPEKSGKQQKAIAELEQLLATEAATPSPAGSVSRTLEFLLARQTLATPGPKWIRLHRLHDRAVAAMGHGLQLLLLRPRRCPTRYQTQKCRCLDQLFLLFLSHPDHLLSAADVWHGAGERSVHFPPTVSGVEIWSWD